MEDWASFTLLLYIYMRMTGFFIGSPIFSRSNVPALVRSALALTLTLAVYASYEGTAAGYAAVMGARLPEDYMAVLGPVTLAEAAARLLLELTIGLCIGMMTRVALMAAEQAGEVVDTQMGLSMARSYDPSSQSTMTVTANLLNTSMLLIFFACGGHMTLLRLMAVSGETVPYGTVSIGPDLTEYLIQFFVQFVVLSVKLSFPILGSELLGQIGMGVLMKVIPQINVFAINIELKVIIGLIMLLFLIGPMSAFLRDAEALLLGSMEEVMALFAGRW